jgi:hypothetical protein
MVAHIVWKKLYADRPAAPMRTCATIVQIGWPAPSSVLYASPNLAREPRLLHGYGSSRVRQYFFLWYSQTTPNRADGIRETPPPPLPQNDQLILPRRRLICTAASSWKTVNFVRRFGCLIFPAPRLRRRSRINFASMISSVVNMSGPSKCTSLQPTLPPPDSAASLVPDSGFSKHPTLVDQDMAAEIVQPRTSYDPCYLLLKISTKHECNFFMNRSSSLYCIIVVLCFNRWKYLLSMPSRSPPEHEYDASAKQKDDELNVAAGDGNFGDEAELATQVRPRLNL